MATYIEGRFVGQEHAGFYEGQTYQLCIEQDWRGKLTVAATHGYEFKPVQGIRCTYKGLADFLTEWKVLRVVRPNAVA